MFKIHVTRCKITTNSKYCRKVLSSKSFSSNTQQSKEWRSLFETQTKTKNISLEGYYNFSAKSLDEPVRKVLNKEFHGSMYNALSTLFPEIEWLAWKFEYQNVPQGFWNELSNQRKFFDYLSKELELKTLDDWYDKISRNLIIENGGRRMLTIHNESPASALMAVYPEHNWIPWKFKTIPHGFWKSIDNQRKYLEWLAEQLKVTHVEDWNNKLTYTVLHQHYGGSLLALYGSPLELLKAVYPQHKWTEKSQPQDKQEENLQTLRTLLEQKNLTNSEWYQLSPSKLDPIVADIIKKQFKGSLYQALCAIFPQIEWLPWRFKNQTVTPEYWKEASNQKKFFEHLGQKLGVQSLDDWYEKLTWQVMRANGGNGLIKIHGGSPITALMAVYPEHKWVIWKFASVPNKYWNSSDNVRKFLNDLAEKLSVQTLDDWYRVDWAQLQQFDATAVVSKYKGLYNLLKEQYPYHPWDPKRFQQRGKKTQRWLAVTLKKMFPNEEILEDYIHPKVTSMTSQRALELDVFIPSRSLAFEYQGQQHYEDVGIFSPSRTYQQRDEEKRTLCAANNIKLIEVPYWWNRTQEGLQQMIDGAK